MSRSNPTPTNPAQKFFKWKGSKGELVYWDKESEKEIPVKLPFEFLVLDELHTMSGYSDLDQSGYWSNEVRFLNQELTVKTSAGTKQVGLYKDLGEVRSKGAKYAASIYIAYMEKDGWVIGNIKATGAAVSAWFDFKKTCTPENGKVVLTGSTEGKKGATVFKIPTFEYQSSDHEENEIAIELDKELQIYLSQYLAPKIEAGYEEPPLSDEDIPVVEEELPLSFK